MKKNFLFIVVGLFAGCINLPEGITPIKDFEVNRYLGKWYEIARMDHSFERGMDQVTADYSLREDGGVTVLNRGFKTEDKDWNDANGRAYFVEDKKTGFLKVSFFRPFYGAYIIFELDEDYQYAFVAGDTSSYLWLLSRTPTISPELKAHFIEKAQSIGFNTDTLIWVNQK